jgi:drug/metabolite transporter (DMT)-like permease
VFAVLAIVQLFFATLAIAGKIALREMSSSALVLARVGGAALVFFAIHRLTTNEKIRDRRDYLLLALYSVLGVSLNQLLYLAGLESHHRHDRADVHRRWAGDHPRGGDDARCRARHAAQMERHTARREWRADAGRRRSREQPPRQRLHPHERRHLFHLSRAHPRDRPAVPPAQVITWIFAFGAILLVPIGAAPLIRELPELSRNGWLAVVWIIALPTVAAYYLNVWALLHVESSIVSTFVCLQPVLTALMAISILGERPSARLIPSAVLIAAGVAVTLHEQRARESGPSPADQSMVEV